MYISKRHADNISIYSFVVMYGQLSNSSSHNAHSLTDVNISCKFSLIKINHSINYRMWSRFAADGHLQPSGALLKSRELAHYSILIWWSCSPAAHMRSFNAFSLYPPFPHNTSFTQFPACSPFTTTFHRLFLHMGSFSYFDNYLNYY